MESNKWVASSNSLEPGTYGKFCKESHCMESNKWLVSSNSLEPGTYLGACVGLVDLGTHQSEFDDKQVRQIMLVFQLVSGEILGRVTNRLWTKRSTLRKLIEGWFGKALPDSFDLRQILGKRGMLLLAQTKSSVKVDRVGPLPSQAVDFFEGVEFKEPFEFSISAGEPLDSIKLPEWLPFVWGKPVKQYLAEAIEFGGTGKSSQQQVNPY